MGMGPGVSIAVSCMFPFQTYRQSLEMAPETSRAVPLIQNQYNSLEMEPEASRAASFRFPSNKK